MKNWPKIREKVSQEAREDWDDDFKFIDVQYLGKHDEEYYALLLIFTQDSKVKYQVTSWNIQENVMDDEMPVYLTNRMLNKIRKINTKSLEVLYG